MACAIVFVEGKDDYTFFKQAFVNKSFTPCKFTRVVPELEHTACEKTISNARHLFKTELKQLFANEDKRVMLVGSSGKTVARTYFESVSKNIAIHSTVGMRLLLIRDSDEAPDPNKLRERMLERLIGLLEEIGMDVERDQADSSITSCTASKYQTNLRAGVMTVSAHFDEVFAGFLAKHHPDTKDEDPKIAIAKTAEKFPDGKDGLCRHAFEDLQAKRDPRFSKILDELCEFVHG